MEEMRAIQQPFWDKVDSISKNDLVLTSRLCRGLCKDDKRPDRAMKWDGCRLTFVQMDKCEHHDRIE